MSHLALPYHSTKGGQSRAGVGPEPPRVTPLHPAQGLALKRVNKYLLTEDVRAQGSGGGG